MRKLTQFLLLIFVVSGLGCSHNTKLNPDLDLVLPYTRSLEKNKAYNGPYLATFSKGSKKLFFVAADHVPTKMKNPLTHPTMRTVQKVFSENKIGAVVVEGIQPWSGSLSESLKRYTDKCTKDNFRGGCGESFYALSLGLKSEQPVSLLSGEPSEEVIAKQIEAAGYSRKDLAAFYLVRIIPQWKRRGIFNKSKIKEMVERQLKKYRHRVGLKESFGYSDFIAWYKANMKQPKSFLDIKSGDTAPHGGPDATYVNKVSHQVGIVRDREIVRNIADILNQKNNVLVVYGGSHLVIQEPALIDMLGEPKYTQPFGYEEK